MYRLRSLIALTLALISCACSDPQAGLQNGIQSPDFQLVRLDGLSVKLSRDYRDKVVAIRFWADWCPFCENEMKHLEGIYDKYRSQGLAILAINVRQEKSRVENFVSRLGLSYEILLDSKGEVTSRYLIKGLPTTYFIDRNGRIRERILGESPTRDFEAVIRRML